jgi:hypothetical protein
VEPSPIAARPGPLWIAGLLALLGILAPALGCRTLEPLASGGHEADCGRLTAAALSLRVSDAVIGEGCRQAPVTVTIVRETAKGSAGETVELTPVRAALIERPPADRRRNARAERRGGFGDASGEVLLYAWTGRPGRYRVAEIRQDARGACPGLRVPVEGRLTLHEGQLVFVGRFDVLESGREGAVRLRIRRIAWEDRRALRERYPAFRRCPVSLRTVRRGGTAGARGGR